MILTKFMAKRVFDLPMKHSNVAGMCAAFFSGSSLLSFGEQPIKKKLLEVSFFMRRLYRSGFGQTSG